MSTQHGSLLCATRAHPGESLQSKAQIDGLAHRRWVRLHRPHKREQLNFLREEGAGEMADASLPIRAHHRHAHQTDNLLSCPVPCHVRTHGQPHINLPTGLSPWSRCHALTQVNAHAGQHTLHRRSGYKTSTLAQHTLRTGGLSLAPSHMYPPVATSKPKPHKERHPTAGRQSQRTGALYMSPHRQYSRTWTHTPHARQDGSTDLTVPQEVELVDAVVHALHVLEDVGPCVGRGTQGRHVARLQQGRPRTSARTERHSTSLSDACSQYDTSLLSAHACECECRTASVCVCVCARVSVLACVHCLASARDGLLRGHSQAAWGCPRTQGTGQHVCP